MSWRSGVLARWALVLLVLVGADVLGSSAQAQAQAQAPVTEPPAVMIVFDGSGSMWGRLDGDKQAKFVTARDGLKAALSKLEPKTKFGLAAFGHRRQGDCSDAQVILAPEALGTGDRLESLLEKHNPKGKGPITLALREAAKALPKGAGRKSIVVIHDDLDNCGVDVCSALADIQTAGATVYAVGIALKGEDAQRLQCLAGPTGGKVIDGQTGAILAAGLDDVLKLASLDSAPRTAVPPPRAAVASVAPSIPSATPAVRPGLRKALLKDGPSALRLATVLSANQPPMSRAVKWTVRKADESAAVVYTGSGQDVIALLAAGAYKIEARDGLLPVKSIDATVGAVGQTGVDLVLDAGVLRVAAALAPLDAVVTLFQSTPDAAEGKAAAVVSALELEAGVALPVGLWRLRAAEGNARVDRTVEVKAGAVTDLAWPFARLQLTIAGQAVSSRVPVTVVVYEDDPEAPRGRREIARSSASNPDFVLAPGTYAVVARQGAVETRDRVALQGGETAKRTLSLTGGRLALASRLAGLATAVAPGSEEPVSYRIERLDVVPVEVFSANRQQAEMELPAGRYRVEARHGLINARASRDVILGAGQAATVTIEQQAGTLRLIGPTGSVSDMFWEILDITGHPIWSTAQVSPRATLQAGRYVIRLDIRTKRLERRIEVRSGEIRDIKVDE